MALNWFPYNDQRSIRSGKADRPALLFSVFVTVVVMAPHLLRLPPWIALVSMGALTAFVLGVIKGLGYLHRDELLLKIARAFVAVIAMVVVYVNNVGQLGRDAGVEFLVVLTALKFFEVRQSRDQTLIASLGFVLIAANFFYDQSPFAAAWALAGMLLLILSLAINEAGRVGTDRRRVLRPVGSIVGFAAPIAVLAFVVFPRIPGPLWGNTLHDEIAETGLSNELSMGAITDLIASDAVAFHAEFEGPPPPVSQRYWRAIVLGRTDGRRWRTLPYAVFRADDPTPRGQAIEYEISLKAHGQHYVPALDMPEVHPRGLRRTRQLTLYSRKPITKGYRAQMASYSRMAHPELVEYQQAVYLELPADAHPRSRALAESWRAAGDGPEAIVNRALDYFREERFVYTLQPPLLSGDPVDEFLFESRAGFCEHFASAFATLMRAAGIPARIVTGYQGGEFNELGDYFVIRQRDAHAWAEVYIRERGGWVRVDPTAVIAPDRVETGINAYRDVRYLGFGSNSPIGRMAFNLSLTLDYVRMEWNRWVVGFDGNRQRELFSRMNLAWLAEDGFLAAVLIALIGAGGLAFGWLVTRERRSSDGADHAYRRFLKKCARAGLPRWPGETPAQFARRVKQRFPAGAENVAAITALYQELKYRRAARVRTRDLKLAVRRLRLT